MRSRIFWSVAPIFALAACKSRSYNSADEGAQPLAWDVASNGWTAADEKGFSEYVEKIGTARMEGKCNGSSVVECIAKVPPANLAPEAVPSLGVIDCGRLPFLLRAYYAYRMKLPFAYNKIDNATLEGRYTPNNVTGFRDQSESGTVAGFFKSAVGNYFTAYYRIPTETNPAAPNAFSDTYPVAVDRAGIRPGTIYYDVAGHVAIVFKVYPDGTIDTWNGHPDGSNSIKEFNDANFPSVPSGSRRLGGFLRFRGWNAVGNGADKKAIPNPSQEAFSLDQYNRPWSKEGKTFYEWTEKKLAIEPINPMFRFPRRVKELCDSIGLRVENVKRTMRDGIASKPHPGTIPLNIFQAKNEEWETYSTPGGDMRIRSGFIGLRKLVSESLAATSTKDTTKYRYNGSPNDLGKAFFASWNEFKASSRCIHNPLNSAGKGFTITLESAVKSVFDWSFDPYHCPELRWGQIGSATCPADAAKQSMFVKETKLRWNTQKPDAAESTSFEFGNNASRPETDILPLLKPYL
jgi:hypothetical protein